MQTLQDLIDCLPQTGIVRWIGIRPKRREPVKVLNEVEARTDGGLVGDRYAGRTGDRQVTLVQHEHLAVVASVLDVKQVSPEKLRRNIVVSGINLLALKDKQFQIGGSVLQFTGLCHPCSFMEESLGLGGYNAMRGHGGITARVIENGVIRINDNVEMKLPEC